MLREIPTVFLASISLAYGQPAGGVESSPMIVLSARLGPAISHEAPTTGAYSMGDSTTILRSTDGTSVPILRPPPSIIEQEQPGTQSQTAGALPLHPDLGYPRLRHFPSFDIGLGVRFVQMDFSGLTEVYGGTPEVGSQLLTLGFDVSTSESFSIQVEAAHTASGQDVAEGSAGAAYYVTPFDDRNIRPFISACWTFCSVEIRNLSGPNTDAGTKGIGIFLGLEYVAGLDAAFDLYGGYTFMPKLSQDYYYNRPIPASVRLGGAAFGVRFKILQ